MEQLEWTSGLNFNSSSCPNQSLLLLQRNSCICSFSDATWRPQRAHSCPHSSSVDTGPSFPFAQTHLEAAGSSGLFARLSPLSQHSSSEDASPSPPCFLRAHLEATGSSGLSAGLILLSWHGSSSEDSSPSPSLFLRARERRGGWSWGRMRMGDGEGRVIGSSSWRRGSPVDGDISAPRWKSRAPGVPPADVLTSPRKHDVTVLAWL